MRFALLVAVVLASATPARAEVACMRVPMRQQQIASAKNQISGTGGVIIASGSELPDWRFRDMNRVVRARITKLAPGLAIYRPPPLPGTDVVLEDADHNERVSTKRMLSAGPVPDAPEVEAVTASAPSSSRPGVLAELTERVPAGVVVAILSRVDGDKLVPLAWTKIAGQPAAILIWHAPGMCEEYVPEAIEPKRGDKVVLTWLDETGRLSAPSKPATIETPKAR